MTHCSFQRHCTEQICNEEVGKTEEMEQRIVWVVRELETRLDYGDWLREGSGSEEHVVAG